MKIEEILTVVPGSELRSYTVDGLERQAIWVIPERLQKQDGRQPLYLGLDAWSPDERQGVVVPNGGGDLCHEFGLPGIFPLPYPEWFGYWRGWSIPGGALRPSKHNDEPFIGMLLDQARAQFGELTTTVAAFSDAAIFMWLLDLSMPDRFNCLVSVNGSAPQTQQLPPNRKRKSVVVIHGDSNPILPFTGGVGKGLIPWLRTRVAVNPKASHPTEQIERYLVHSDLPDVPETAKNADFTQTQYGPDDACIVQYVVRRGGHAWYGRKEGPGMESKLSGFNKGKSNPNFDVNSVIARHSGWRRLDPPRLAEVPVSSGD